MHSHKCCVFIFFRQKLDRRKFTFTENIRNGQLQLCQYSQSISKSIFRIRLKKKGVKVKKHCGQWWNVESGPRKIKKFSFFCQKVAKRAFWQKLSQHVLKFNCCSSFFSKTELFEAYREYSINHFFNEEKTIAPWKIRKRNSYHW